MMSLEKIFGLYTVGFLGVTVLIGIGEALGLFSNQMIGWIFMALSLAIYVVIGAIACSFTYLIAQVTGVGLIVARFIGTEGSLTRPTFGSPST